MLVLINLISKVCIKKYFDNSEIDWNAPLQPHQRVKMDERKQNNTVKRRETLAFLLKKVSASDQRPTSTAMGSILGIGIFVLLGTIVVLPDVPRLVHDVKNGQAWVRAFARPKTAKRNNKNNKRTSAKTKQKRHASRKYSKIAPVKEKPEEAANVNTV